MSLILYINGQQADLEPGTVIAQTRQVNDLNSLENRQASYTNKFSLPKTAHNVRLMGYLTLPGNESNIPYQKNECSLYSASGECFVYKGWAMITDGGDSYDAVIYDGIISLYKAIENKNLSDLELSAIDHTKNPQTVVNSWAATSPYRYIFADYNGNHNYLAVADTPVIAEMEYLVPSVNVKWLWNKIFSVYNNGEPATGAIFDSDDFTNLWMTFPKGATSGEEQETELLVCNDILINGSPLNDRYLYYLPLPAGTVQMPVADAVSVTGNRHIKVNTSGNYRIELSGTLRANKTVNISIGINAPNATRPQNITNRSIIKEAHPNNGEEFNYGRTVKLNAGDTACVFFDYNNASFDFHNNGKVNLRLVRIEDTVINFTDAFSDFSIRDFLNEVVYRFGLTLFKSKYSNTYTCLTLAELFNSQVLNWSSKFVRQVSENYITGNYAQRNWFTHTYNDKDASYDDGYYDITNAHLPESKTLIKSKIYSPEYAMTLFAKKFVNRYKMWDKEVTQEQEEVNGETITRTVTNYKPLDKRYYFMRTVYDSRLFFVTSMVTQQIADQRGAWFENYSGLSFKDVVQKYYGPLNRITHNSRVITAELWLSEADVSKFDFKKRYYIEQLSGTFLINKINNYIPGKPVQCEFLRVLPENER
ncbi:hypothetical protein [Flavobacterium psychrotrophum]|uniref:hypothetical protein n=1 Tax=Flavobacterium psychrotrophum TaxID=2294119 RepID=UPI000E3115B5|nr:hypothetical protein [Flavobacterium psychrotrophum]